MATSKGPVALYTKQFGSGPSLVILHGLFGSWENWRSHAQKLSSHFQVTLMDLRNHGKSAHRDHMDYQTMAADVAFTCRELGIEKTHVVGHSMGGKTAMQLTLDFPMLIDKLIVVDIGPGQYPAHHQRILQGLQLLAQQQIASRKDADDTLSSYVQEQPIRSFLLKNLQRNQHGQYQLRLNLKAIVDQYASIAAAISKTDSADTASTPYVPALFIKGGDSDYLQEKDRTAILSLFPAATLKVIVGTGHWLHSEKPELVQKIIRDFLSQESDQK